MNALGKYVYDLLKQSYKSLEIKFGVISDSNPENWIESISFCGFCVADLLFVWPNGINMKFYVETLTTVFRIIVPLMRSEY